MDAGGNQNSEFLFGINTITTLLEENSGHRRIYRIVISGSRKQDSRINPKPGSEMPLKELYRLGLKH